MGTQLRDFSCWPKAPAEREAARDLARPCREMPARRGACVMTERFARIPSRAAGLRGLGARDFRILVALASHCDAAGQCFPSLTRIAAIAGVDRAKVPASIRKLRAAGLVRSPPRRDETGDFA